MTALTVLTVQLGATESAFAGDEATTRIPVGVHTLCDLLASDPPSPEELTNAIGWFQDHLEDAVREVPAAEFADRVEVRGVAVQVLADVELGGDAVLPYEVARDAAEDVYRTLVTEARPARLHNPGITVTAVHTVLGTACAIVGLMRFLHLDSVWLVDDGAAS